MPPPARSHWWREPLVHFLAIGALLFVVFEWRGSPRSSRIVITPGQLDALSAGFARTFQRAPTEGELKGQIDEYVREEIATREAMALGLDRDDTVIRRRLRQKLEFVVEDTLAAAPPSDAELQAWLDVHAVAYRVEPEIAFTQITFDDGRRGPSAEADARRLLARLSATTAPEIADELGDSVMLPNDVPRAPRAEIARLFGDAFANSVVGLEIGRWEGPIRSAYGVHLVYVRERRDGRTPALQEVRAEVERDLVAERRRRQLQAMYEELLGRYRVVVERRDPASTAEAARTGGGASR